ncbi:MAG: sulfatase [Myxococcales bacterium]
MAALLVASGNALPLHRRLAHQLRTATQARVHAYDVALFLSMGAGVALVLGGWSAISTYWSRRLRRLSSVVLLLLAGGALGRWTLADDLANFVGKQDLRFTPAVLGTSAGMLFLPGLALVVADLSKRWQRVLAVVAAFALSGLNASLLPGEYPGLHLIITLGAFGLFGAVLARELPPHIPERVQLVWFASILACAGLPFLEPPSRIVRQNLNVSSGSSLAPFITRFLPQARLSKAQRLALEQTEWFKPRTTLPAIAPHSFALLPSNGVVVLLTVDALRADVVESRKHDSLLPNLALIRDSSRRFTQTRSPTPSTLTTVTSILTGKYYSQIYFTEHEPGKVNPITDRSTRVPELLSRAGVKTVNVRAMWGLGPRYGVGRGFDEDPTTPRDFGRAEQAMDLILARLSRVLDEPSQRLFLYSHFVDSHAPYTLGGKRDTPFQSYLAELELVDRQLGRLLVFLRAKRLTERCLLVVSADHGEAFGEHDTRFHASTVYDELLRVPLMFLHPRLGVGQSDLPVSLIDLSPTLLDLFGLSTPGDFMGQSLVAILANQPVHLSRPIAADAGRRKQALLFKDGIKVHRDLRRGTVQVFDLNDDPGELVDLTDGDARQIDAYIAATERFFEVHTLKVPGWTPPWRNF